MAKRSSVEEPMSVSRMMRGVPLCSLEEVASSEQLASMPAQRMVSKSKRFFFK